ncbi:hypothetical protein [Vibrio splendidus]|uniref:hypothetical protein n=1 Tax=Vibrio splendidus TaxID=29497 RepID=UPI000D3C62A3|nr:hypothetical protein [Vibrio splendidus]PTO55141.1 hypothetical protein CWN96_23470 [Vibrio splendidus]PTP74500.1 hypothetical protein CWO06_13915 [Vibrio splendidus]
MNISTNVKTIDEFGFARELDSEEIKKAMALCFSISLDRTKKSRILYRGVRKSFLTDRLIRSYEESTDYNIASRLFFFGEKSAHFRNELKIQQMRKYLNDIDDISSATCNKIFDLINGLRKSHDDDIIDFQSNHEVFFSFFLDKENKPIFSNMIQELGPKARDYFLGFLHTAGKIGIGNRSTSVSTSYGYDQASLFAGGRTEERYIVISVRRYINKQIRSNTILSKIERLGVPTLPEKAGIFGKQQEETLRAGIFPHDIIGVECLHSNELILNPHIFSERNSNVNIMLSPLDIEQRDFARQLARYTNYSSYFYTIDGECIHEDTAENVF